MGEVYRARCEPDGRVVAIKIEGDRASQDPRARFRERFLREARILRDLRHENLPQFFGVGEVPDGRVFIAMELLVGRPLTEFTGSDLETLIPLFLQCARALKVTAEAGVVHRDVSPDNFFVVEVGGRSVVKLIDFGISRDASAMADGLTRTGTFLGKLRYCSPEQTGLFRGWGPVDWRTDLYSFALTMYAVVLRRLPFPGGSPQQQFQARAVELPADTFSAVPSERLRRLLASMLRRAPGDRPASFDEVIAELLRVQAELAEEQANRLEEGARGRGRGVAEPAAARQAPAASPEVPRPPPRPGTPAPVLRSAERAADSTTFVSVPGLAVAAALLVVGGLVLVSTGPGAVWVPPVLVMLGVSAAVLGASRWRRQRRTAHAAPAAPGPRPATASVPPPRPRPDARGARLVVSGDGPAREIRLGGDSEESWPVEIVIGRAVAEGPGSVRIASRAVSGLQARLLHRGGTFSIENLSRTNTTRVNGRELAASEKRLLAVGDRIEMGPVTISFHV